jgi:hypothetical protein
MYRLSTVNANQLNLAIGKTASKRTANPIITSGIVMASPSLLRYSSPVAAKQAIGIIALTPNEPNKASGQPTLTTLAITGFASALAAAKMNKPQKNWSRFMSRDTPSANAAQPAGLTELRTAVATLTLRRSR